MSKVTLKSKVMYGLLLAACYSASAQAANYNLNCAFGGNMGITYDARAKKVTGTFTAANAGTRTQALDHGQCSWVDRALRSNEPRKFCQRGVNDVVVKMNVRSYAVRSRKAPYLRQEQLGGYFSLKVSNRNGCLNVVRVNPFKKARTIAGR